MKYLFIFLCLNFSFAAFAQDTTINQNQAPHPQRIDNTQGDKGSKGFHKENLFTGGSATISLGSGGTVLGVNPVFGYSVNKWLDAGIAFNLSYLSLRAYDQYNDLYQKESQLIVGPGAFVKIYPVPFLFIQAQIENNFITYNNTYYQPYLASGSIHYSVPAYLTGIGYCGGRQDAGSIYYYLAVLIDLSNNLNSPYLYHTDGSSTIQPILRAGIQIPLFQGKSADRYY